MVLYTFSPGTREGERRRRICEFEVSLVYTMSSRSAKDIYIYIYSETLSQKANIPSFLSLSFFFSETGFLCIVLVVLELTL